MRNLIQTLKDKVQMSRRRWKYKENEYFKTNAAGKYSGILTIELIKGPYKGIIYSYGEISIDEDLGYLGARASYDIQIENTDLDEKTKDQYLCDVNFTKVTSEILLVLLDTIIKRQAELFFNENLNEEYRENYTEEPVSGRTVSEEDPPVSKKRVSARKSRKNSI